jgi:putative ABC transport system permease protein
MSTNPRRSRLLDGLDDEIRDHIERETQDNMDRGMAPEEARRQAMLRFGSVVRIEEDTRAVWTWAWLEQAAQDIRYALRALRRQPVFATTVVLTLAVALGMSTAIFSVMNAVVLRPLGYPDAHRLVWLATAGGDEEPGIVTGPDFVAWRERARSFDRMMAYGTGDYVLVSPRGAVRVRTADVTGDFWDLAGVRPESGRLPAADERDVVVLSHQFARQWFASDSDSDARIIGRAITLGDRRVTIVGVLPEHFRFHLPGALWSVLRPKDIDVYQSMTVSGQRGAGPVQLVNVVGRLDASVTLDSARAELRGIRAQLAREYPNPFEAQRMLRVVPLHDELIGGARPALIVLLGAVACVLLIACANAASLLLARASARQREIAVRLSMGASRARVLRQLLTEGFVLASIGSVVGLLLARGGIALLLRIHPYAIPRLTETTIDARVLAALLGGCVLTTVIVGLAPAFTLRTTRPHEAFRSGGDGGRHTFGYGKSRGRTRGLLVSAQIALALTLVIGAGLLTRSAWRMYAYPAGFEPGRILTATLDFSGQRYSEPRASLSFVETFLARVRNVGGVRAASISTHGYMLAPGLRVEGDPPVAPDVLGRRPPIMINATSSSLKQVLGLRVVRGRWFEDGERAAVLNESLARRELPGRDPIGLRIRMNPDAAPLTIVGVVSDLKYSRLDEAAEPEVYVPFATIDDGLFGFQALILTESDPRALALAPTVRALMAELDPTQVPDGIMSLEQSQADALAPRRMNLFLFGTFAAVAVFVAAIGVYGVMSYAVSRRLHELGVRAALGATRADLVGMVMGQGLRITAIGIVTGIGAALVLTRFMQGLLYDVQPSDPWTFVVVPLGVALTTLAACGIPALRAAFVDPVIILRDE